MNKKFFFLGGAALLAGAFVGLTAFGGMTKAQQLAQIDEAVATQLVALRETKTKECDESIAKAANAKAQEMLAAPVVEEPVKAVAGAKAPVKKPATKKGGTTGTKVDPMPQPAPPAKSTDPASKSKWDGGTAKPTQESEKKWSKPADPNAKVDPNAKPASKSKWDKKEGGN